MPSLTITVVGGGNSSPIFAALCAAQGHNVWILTRKPEKWAKDKVVGFKNEDNKYLNGKDEFYHQITGITSNPKDCIPDSDIIFIAGLPIHLNPILLRQIKPFINANKLVHIGSICSYGGFNWVCRKELGDKLNYNVFGTQLIPWCCGTLKYGKTGVVYGAKRMLRIATENGGKDEHGLKDILRPILQIPELRDVDFLACCLWPNNPSLHPPILYGLFENWDGKTLYHMEKDNLPTFIYKELRKNSSKYLVELDNELQKIVKCLSEKLPNNEFLKLDYSLKACMLENYKDQISNDYSVITAVMTNKAFGSHKMPYTKKKTGNGDNGIVVPTLKHKFFETDLPFGLITWYDIAVNFLKIEIPLITKIIFWNQRLINKDYLSQDGQLNGKDIDECIVPSKVFGMKTVQELQ